jgi:hypothetical protein
MTVQRGLYWFFRLESWIALAGGGMLLGFGGFLGFGIWAGTVELSLGSDLPKGAMFAVVTGALVLAFGYLCHRAAESVRSDAALERPPAWLAASIACHIAVLTAISAGIAF